MADFSVNYTKLHEVISRFDLCLTQKAGKIQVDLLEMKISEDFVKTENQKKFTDKIDRIITERADGIEQKLKDLENLKEEIQCRMQNEMLKIHNKVDGSHLENEASNFRQKAGRNLDT